MQEGRRVLGIDLDSERAALLWAMPFMLFLAFPIAGAFHMGLSTVQGAGLLAITVAFGAAYIATWWINPVAPVSPRLTWRLAGCMIVLLVLQLAMELVATTGRGDVSGTVMMLTYAVSCWILLSPRPLMWPGFALIMAIGFAEAIIIRGEQVFYVVFAGLTAGVVYLARYSIESGRDKEVAHRQSVVLAEERERTRISGDLHDILGHTLTGISVKADLAGRLLDAGRTDEARAQIDDLTDMAREALADVRGVVQHNKTLDPDAELESARDVLSAAGAKLVVAREGNPVPGTSSSLIAHVIRESVTNALLHATPDRVDVELRPRGVTVTNNGYSARMSQKTRGGGTGLEGLRTRIGTAGTLTVGPRPGTDLWDVDLEVGDG